jgi:multidrug efflux pump subunit AcrA (membrane-fusion protein)
MRPCIFVVTLLALLAVLSGCKPEDAPAALRLVRTLVVDPKSIREDRHAIGEVKPRYESDLSFRVAGKVLSRLVDVGAWVKQGDTLATLDTQRKRMSAPPSRRSSMRRERRRARPSC